MTTAIDEKLGRGRQSSKYELALEQLDTLCRSMLPGDRFPTHVELMSRFASSERSILRALDELQRRGQIIRRQGSGTFVAEGASAVQIPVLAAKPVESRTILAIRTPDSSFFDRCMDVLFRCADDAGLSLVCQLIAPDADPETVPLTPTGDALGCILFSYRLVPLARRLRDNGCRVVVVGAPPMDVVPDVPCVFGDHERGGYLAARHLIDLGHRSIAFQSADENTLKTQRWKGFNRAIEESGRKGIAVKPTVLWQAECDGWIENPRSASAYFDAPEAPTGIMAWNDSEAAILMAALKTAGVRIPENVSLVGYDNLPAGQIVDPALTTVDHSVDWQLGTAIELLKMLKLPSPSHTAVIAPVLILRASTAPPARKAIGG